MYDKRLHSHGLFETIHVDDLGEVLYKIFDIPVYAWDSFDSLRREKAQLKKRVRASKGPGIPAEVLPGEIMCDDHVVRRETAAADRPIVGMEESLTTSGSTVRRVSIEEAEKLAKEGANIVWRPQGTVEGGHYALEVIT